MVPSLIVLQWKPDMHFLFLTCMLHAPPISIIHKTELLLNGPEKQIWKMELHDLYNHNEQDVMV
jgi:hypothetical protein